MRLCVNGKEREFDGATTTTIERLIETLGVHRMIVVEHNGVILKREQYATATLRDGDNVEIVHMVGGG